MYWTKLMPIGENETKNSLLKDFLILEDNQEAVQGYMHDCGLLSNFNLKEEQEKYKGSFILYLVADDKEDIRTFANKWEFTKISSLPNDLHLMAGMYNHQVAGIDWILAYN